MSDVDTLIVMFQTQLSDVMDTLVKTAMRELTRLVEDGFVEEVRRRTRDAESLRAQLQWAEKKLSDAAAAAAQAGDEAPGPAGSSGTSGRCVDCGKALCRGGDGTTGEAAEEEEEEEENIATELLQYGVLIGCDMKQEDDAMELCTGSHGQEVMSELAQEADVPVLVLSPVRESATMEQATARPVVDVKKEEVNEPSCSAEHAGDWHVSHDDRNTLQETHRTQERLSKVTPQRPPMPLMLWKTNTTATDRSVMDTLGEIQLRLQDITAGVHNIEAGMGRGRRPPRPPSEELTDVQLPLQSLGDFDTLEEKLQNARTKNTLLSKLSLCGGDTLKRTVWRICAKVFSPQLAVQLNWCGRGPGRKRGIRDTRVKDLLMSAAMCSGTAATSSSEAHAEKVLKEWLRLAGNRLVLRTRGRGLRRGLRRTPQQHAPPHSETAGVVRDVEAGMGSVRGPHVPSPDSEMAVVVRDVEVHAMEAGMGIEGTTRPHVPLESPDSETASQQIPPDSETASQHIPPDSETASQHIPPDSETASQHILPDSEMAVVVRVVAALMESRTRPHVPSEELTGVQLPLQSLEDLDALEERLQNARTKNTLLSTLSWCRGETLKKTLGRICAKVFSPQLAVQLNWCGRGPGRKRGIRDTRVTDLLMSLAVQNGPAATSGEDMEKVVKEWLRLAADRLNARRR